MSGCQQLKVAIFGRYRDPSNVEDDSKSRTNHCNNFCQPVIDVNMCKLAASNKNIAKRNNCFVVEKGV